MCGQNAIDGVSNRGSLGDEKDLASRNLRRHLLSFCVEDSNCRWGSVGKGDGRFHDIFARDVERIEEDDGDAASLGVEP